VFSFHRIEAPAAAANRVVQRLKLKLNDDGSGSGSYELAAIGALAQYLRFRASDEKAFQNFLFSMVDTIVQDAHLEPAQVMNENEVLRPVSTAVQFTSSRALKRDGDSLVARPAGYSLRVAEGLDDERRRWPVVFDYPVSSEVEFTLELPPSLQVTTLPEAASIESPCLAASQQFSRQPGRVIVKSRYEVRCDSIGVDEFAKYRDVKVKIDEMFSRRLSISAVGSNKAKTGARASTNLRAHP
jgi:hypothetical protein